MTWSVILPLHCSSLYITATYFYVWVIQEYTIYSRAQLLNMTMCSVLWAAVWGCDSQTMKVFKKKIDKMESHLSATLVRVLYGLLRSLWFCESVWRFLRVFKTRSINCVGWCPAVCWELAGRDKWERYQPSLLTLCTSYCTLNTAHFTLHTSHCTLNTAHFILNTAHYPLNTAHYILNTVCCTLQTAHCTANFKIYS